MKSKVQKNTQKIDKVTAQSQSFEISLASTAKKSERRAWFVAISSVLMSVLLAAGYLFVMPLKEKVPYLIVADPYTGSTSVAKLTGDFQNNTITKSEAINKSNVANFVIGRESYDWDLISRRDWNTVYAMASKGVAEEYGSLFSPGNPSNPDTIYGRQKSLRVKIKTIVLTNGADGTPKGATIRFDRLLIDKLNPRIEASDSKIATLSFEYKDNLGMKEEYRIENPLGFRVTAYRVDPEAGNVNSTLLGAIESLPPSAATPMPTAVNPTSASAPILQQPAGGPVQ